MNYSSLTDVINQEEKEVNPFSLLGIEPWLIKSMEISTLKSFLQTHKKTIGKFYHPDNFTDETQKIYYEHFFKKVTSTIEELLSNEFYFRKNLDEFRETNQIPKLQNMVKNKNEEIKSLNDKNKKLTQRIKKTTIKYNTLAQDILNTFSEIKKTNYLLIPTDKTLSILEPNNQPISFINNHINNPKYTLKIRDLFTNDKQGLDLEIYCRKIIQSYIENNHYDKSEGEKTTEDKIKPTFHGRVIGNKIKIENKDTPHKYNDLEIMGGLTYQAIKGYYNIHNIPLLENQEQNSMTPHRFLNNFHLSTISKSEQENKYLEKVTPFLSKNIFPLSPVIVKEEKTKTNTEYKIIFPIMFERYKDLYNKLHEGNN